MCLDLHPSMAARTVAEFVLDFGDFVENLCSP
jgi:hypothetical protein